MRANPDATPLGLTDNVDEMNPGTLDDAVAELATRRRQSWEAGALAAVTGLLAVAAGLLAPRFTLALAAGAAVELLLAGSALFRRRNLLGRLAVQRSAYVIPEVKRYGCRFARLDRRRQLALSIRSLLDERRRRGTVCLPERVEAYAHELDALAAELLSPATEVDPPSAVACFRLLTEGVESPLYNPQLPVDDLGLVLSRIRAGIHRSADGGGRELTHAA